MPVQDRRSVLEIVEIPVVEGDEHRTLGKRPALDVVRKHRVEIDDDIPELLQLRHLLVEERDRHRHPVVRLVVDLVVHEDTQRAVVAVDDTDAPGRLADRTVDGVLQNLLDLLAHASRLARDDRADERKDPGAELIRRYAPVLGRQPRSLSEPRGKR